MTDPPDRGDIVWTNLDPRIGHEQSGHRPVLILTPRAFNLRRGLAVGCPLTSRIHGHLFEVVVGRDPPSVVLVDQVRTIDWRTRGARFREQAAAAVLDEVIDKLVTLVAG